MFIEFVLRNAGFCFVLACCIGAGGYTLYDLSRGAFARDDIDALTVRQGEIVEVDQ